MNGEIAFFVGFSATLFVGGFWAVGRAAYWKRQYKVEMTRRLTGGRWGNVPRTIYNPIREPDEDGGG